MAEFSLISETCELQLCNPREPEAGRSGTEAPVRAVRAVRAQKLKSASSRMRASSRSREPPAALPLVNLGPSRPFERPLCYRVRTHADTTLHSILIESSCDHNDVFFYP